MKTLFLLSLAISLFGADIQRLEGIVEEITNLRSEYETCQAKLSAREEGIVASHIENTNSDTFLLEKIKELEESIQAKNILANIQAREITNLKQKNKQILKEMKRQEALTSVVQSVKNNTPSLETLCKESNPFPELIMKKQKEK
jgi:GTPase involved in cell partitioning and DNA repair